MVRLLLAMMFLFTSIFSSCEPSFATVTSNVTKVTYAGDGVSTSFNFGTGGYSIPVYASTDIQVYVQNTTSGVVTQLTLNTNYSVTLTQASYTLSNSVVYYTATISLAGGSLPYGALPSGTNLILNRSIPYTNLINITDYSATPAATWNQGYDRVTMMAQQLYTLTQQAVLQNVAAISPITVPVASSGLCLGWTGTTLSNVTCGAGTSIPVPIPNSYLQTLTTAALVDGSSIVNLTNISSSTWNALNNNQIQPTAVNWSAIPNYTTSGVNWSMLIPSSTGVVNWVQMQGVAPTSGKFGSSHISGLFGSWQSKSATTSYQATTDGFMSAYLYASGIVGVNCITDSSSSPTTLRSAGTTNGSLYQSGCSNPVRKGDYYEFTINGSAAANYYFISMGS